MKILADGSLPQLKEWFPPPFTLTLYYSAEQISTLLPEHDILLCRSTLQVNKQLLESSPVIAVATASSGTDHIDLDYLKTRHITCFDAKGSNATAVADYVVATLSWLQLQQRLTGNKAGIIGVGAVGSQVAKRLIAAGFSVLYFDPPKAALYADFPSCTWQKLTSCDLLCIHANLHDTSPFSSYHLINQEFLAALKPGCTLINAARGHIVDEQALLHNQHHLTYCTDVFSHEPQIDPDVIAYATLCTPHIAGHSIEAKHLAISQLSQQLHDYYQLPQPKNAFIQPTLCPLSSTGTWPKDILTLYNPEQDTHALKQAANKELAFVQLRRAHNQRHDFKRYLNETHTPMLQALLGYS